MAARKEEISQGGPTLFALPFKIPLAVILFACSADREGNKMNPLLGSTKSKLHLIQQQIYSPFFNCSFHALLPPTFPTSFLASIMTPLHLFWSTSSATSVMTPKVSPGFTVARWDVKANLDLLAPSRSKASGAAAVKLRRAK